MFEFCQKMIHSIFDSILLLIQFNRIFIQLEKQGIRHHYTRAKCSSAQWALWAAYGHFIRLVLRAHPARLIAASIIAVCSRFTDNQNFIKRASHLGRVLSFPIKQFPFNIYMCHCQHTTLPSSWQKSCWHLALQTP